MTVDWTAGGPQPHRRSSAASTPGHDSDLSISITGVACDAAGDGPQRRAKRASEPGIIGRSPSAAVACALDASVCCMEQRTSSIDLCGAADDAMSDNGRIAVKHSGHHKKLLAAYQLKAAAAAAGLHAFKWTSAPLKPSSDLQYGLTVEQVPEWLRWAWLCTCHAARPSCAYYCAYQAALTAHDLLCLASATCPPATTTTPFPRTLLHICMHAHTDTHSQSQNLHVGGHNPH